MSDIIKSKNPMVSIVIPCFNAEKYIEDSIKSALSQTYDSFEVIVINDGSSDKSEEIILKFITEISYRKTVNRGANAARNLGIAISRGEYIQFLDADDILFPSCLNEKIEFMIQTGKIPVSNYIKIQFDGAVSNIGWEKLSNDSFISMLNSSPWTAAPIYPKEALLKISGFDENLSCGQEFELAVRLAINTDIPDNFASLKIPLAVYRHTPGSISSNGKLSDILIRLFIKWDKELSHANLLTNERKYGLSCAFANAARWKFRAGHNDDAMDLWKRSKFLSPQGWRSPYPKNVQKFIVWVAGPIFAETLFKKFRVFVSMTLSIVKL